MRSKEKGLVMIEFNDEGINNDQPLEISQQVEANFIAQKMKADDFTVI